MKPEREIMPLRHAFLRFKKVIRLPEYEYVGLTEPELSIIDTAEFQRLRRIRQTPGVSLVYPGANHTRFEHSLGVAYLAGEAAASALSEEIGYLSDNHLNEYLTKWKDARSHIQKIRLAALLHDIGHGPFSHTYELFHQKVSIENPKKSSQLWNHEIAGIEIIRSQSHLGGIISNKTSYTPDEIIQVLSKDKTETMWLKDLILSPVYNVDRLNYLILDARRAGTLEYGLVDAQRLINNFYIYDGRITVGKKAEDAALRSFEAYTHMYRSVYLHQKARGADLQIAYALYYAYNTGDFDWLYNPKIEDLLTLWDDYLLGRLHKEVEDEKCIELLQRYLKRDILKCIFRTTNMNIFKIAPRGINEMKNDILREIPHIKEHQLFLDIVTISPPAPLPIDPESLKTLQFFDERTKRLSPIEPNRINFLIALLSDIGLPEIRIYTFKEFEKDVMNILGKIFSKYDFNVTL
jgi:HD superfamily phosphohydrolase